MANMSNWSTSMTSSRNGSCNAQAQWSCPSLATGMWIAGQRFIQHGASKRPTPISILESALPCGDLAVIGDDRIEVSRRKVTLSTHVKLTCSDLDDPARPDGRRRISCGGLVFALWRRPRRCPDWQQQKRFERISKMELNQEVAMVKRWNRWARTPIQGAATWRSISTTRSCRLATARPRRNSSAEILNLPAPKHWGPFRDGRHRERGLSRLHGHRRRNRAAALRLPGQRS